jgi:hypothetical protein
MRAHKDNGIQLDRRMAGVNGDFAATWFGDGPELERAKEVVCEQHLEGKISFAGNQPHGEILTAEEQRVSHRSPPDALLFSCDIASSDLRTLD